MSLNGRPSRAGDYPRITFHAQDRTFDRLLKESSLSDLKKTVRMKLGLKSESVVQLAQLRHGQSIDLEDEADFDAFYSLAYEQRLVAVQVTLVDNLSAEEPAHALEERPRKKYKRKHEAQTPPEQEAELHVENHGKKRKVAFTEPSAEIDEPTSSPEEPKKKKKKDDSSSIAAVAEPDRGSSHDSSEALKKKKRKRKSTVDSEVDDGAPSSTLSKHHPPPPGSDTEPKPLPGANSDQLPGVPQHSTSTEQEGPVAVKVPATRSRKKGLAPTESSTLEGSPGVSVSSTTKTSKKNPSRRKSEHANEKEAKPRLPAGSIDDANASSGNPDGAQKDDNLAGNVREKDGSNILNHSKGETKTRKRSSTVNANNTKMPNIDNGPVVLATVKEIVAKVTKKKRSTVASPSPVDASGSSPDSAPVDDRAVTNNKTKVPEDGATKGAGPSKTSAEASTTCLVCNRTPKHELVDCPIVEEGPASIQKRIKSLRARKIPDLPLISELQKIKAEQRESGKRKAREVKKVAIEPRSQSAPSPSADEGTKDVGGHTNDVAGVSKESRSVNQTSLSSESSSGTPLHEILSLDAGTHPIIDAQWVDNNGPITLLDIGDVSGLASFDLDVLMKGPESSFLSINDMPSSDEDSDEEEKMSGEPDSDGVEKIIFAELMRDDSSDSDTNDSQDDEPNESEKQVVGSLKYTQSPETDNSKQSEDSDTSGDSGSDVNGGDASTVNAVRDTENTGTTGGQADDTTSAPNTQSSSPNPMNTSEEQQNMNEDREAKQDPLEGVSSNEEPPRPRNGREEFLSPGSTSSRRKHVKAAKTTKKTDGVSLSQVSKELEESAARNSKTPKNKLASNTSNRSAAKLAADIASAQRSPTSAWTALKESSSHPDDDGSILVDELLSSSPVATRSQPRRNKKAFNETASKDDISEPPNSQPLLHLSQKTRLQDPIEDAESHSEKEAKDGDSRRRTRNSRYRRLSEIRSESIHKSLQVPRMTPLTPRDKTAELYGKRGRANENEEESESSSDSDSVEVEKQSHSHIPKRRVAGIS